MKKTIWPWIVLSILVFQFSYWPTRLAGFVTDFTGLAERIETHGAAGIPSSFGFPALQPLTSIFYYLFYHNFSVDGWGWYLGATILHAANALLLFLLIRRLLTKEDHFTTVSISGLGALLFLFSPYASEVLVWRVCFHYLLVTFLALLTLWYTQAWLEQPNARSWWKVMILQILALMSYELGIIIPLLSLSLIVWHTRKAQMTRAVKRLFVPQFSLVGFYFLANRLILGSWIGHYGSEVHLRFPIDEMIANVGRYFIKWVGFSRYWPHAWKENVALGFTKPLGLALIVFLSIGLLYWMFKSFRQTDRKGQLIWVFGIATFLALVPVLNLYFNYLLHIENDRYGYLPALFFYPALAALLSRLPKKVFIGIGCAYLLCSIWLLRQTNSYWEQSTEVYRSLLADFDSYERDTCYLLNLPDNLQGAPMFRDFSGQDRAFTDALQYVQKKSYDGVLHEVVQYNMTATTDGAQVEMDSTDLKVTFNQWGNWWWRRGIGASSYRDSTYIFKNEGHHYRLEWSDKPKEADILYQVGIKWKRFDGLMD